MRNKESFENIKQYKKYQSAGMHNLKLIDANGRVFITDAPRVIPTDIQLNFINKNKDTNPFTTLVEEFVLTERMV